MSGTVQKILNHLADGPHWSRTRDPRAHGSSCGRVLFAWELGSNLGHLTRDLPLARRCRAMGFEVIFAVPHPEVAAVFLAHEYFTVVQAPRLARSRRRSAPPINFADMLLHEGYDDSLALGTAIRGWVEIIERLRPACLIYNHSPTALIAARMVRIPVTVVGTGFEIPPNAEILPSIRPWLPISDQSLLDVEENLIAQINLVWTGAHRHRLGRLVELYGADDIQLTTFAELDYFAPRAAGEYLGPVAALPAAAPIAWRSEGRRRIFAYLRPSIPGIEPLLAALSRVDADVLCVVPKHPPLWAERFPRLQWVAHPVALEPLLPQTDLVVTYGAGTATHALLAGRPVLVVPQVIEQYLAGLCLERTGAAMMLRNDRVLATCTILLNAALESKPMRTMAQAFADRHRAYCVPVVVARQYHDLESRLARSSEFKDMRYGQ